MRAALDIADNWFNIMRLELTVDASNFNALHLYTKLGFVKEGEAHAHSFGAGRYQDVIFMARIKPA